MSNSHDLKRMAKENGEFHPFSLRACAAFRSIPEDHVESVASRIQCEARWVSIGEKKVTTLMAELVALAWANGYNLARRDKVIHIVKVTRKIRIASGLSMSLGISTRTVTIGHWYFATLDPSRLLEEIRNTAKVAQVQSA